MIFDPKFDPYEELLIARHNISELINGLNHYSHLMSQLTEQHNNLIILTKDLQQRVYALEVENHSLTDQKKQ